MASAVCRERHVLFHASAFHFFLNIFFSIGKSRSDPRPSVTGRVGGTRPAGPFLSGGVGGGAPCESPVKVRGTANTGTEAAASARTGRKWRTSARGQCNKHVVGFFFYHLSSRVQVRSPRLLDLGPSHNLRVLPIPPFCSLRPGEVQEGAEEPRAGLPPRV